MTVYVDDAKHPYGGMVMCHMWADSTEELLAMADRIGVKRKWLQKPPKAQWVHFDIASGKRALAIAHGAVKTDKYGPFEHTCRAKLKDPKTEAEGREGLARIEALRAEHRKQGKLL